MYHTLVDLSQPWSNLTPGWPTYSAPIIQWAKKLSTERVNAQRIETMLHVGTHIDAALHFVTNGKDVASLPLARLYGPAAVADVSDRCADYDIYEPEDITAKVEVREGDILIIHTGYHRYAFDQPEGDEVRYFCKHPGPNRRFAEWCLDMKLRWIGVDCGSADHPMNTIVRRLRPDLPPRRSGTWAGPYRRSSPSPATSSCTPSSSPTTSSTARTSGATSTACSTAAATSAPSPGASRAAKPPCARRRLPGRPGVEWAPSPLAEIRNGPGVRGLPQARAARLQIGAPDMAFYLGPDGLEALPGPLPLGLGQRPLPPQTAQMQLELVARLERVVDLTVRVEVIEAIHAHVPSPIRPAQVSAGFLFLVRVHDTCQRWRGGPDRDCPDEGKVRVAGERAGGAPLSPRRLPGARMRIWQGAGRGQKAPSYTLSSREVYPLRNSVHRPAARLRHRPLQ